MSYRTVPSKYSRYIEYKQGKYLSEWILTAEAYRELSGIEIEDMRHILWTKHYINVVHDSVAVTILMDRVIELEKRMDLVEDKIKK